MGMKILVAGTPRTRSVDAWWNGRAIHCPQCKAVFEIEPGDNVVTLAAPERHAEIVCPTEGCSNVLWIYPKESGDHERTYTP